MSPRALITYNSTYYLLTDQQVPEFGAQGFEVKVQALGNFAGSYGPYCKASEYPASMKHEINKQGTIQLMVEENPNA